MGEGEGGLGVRTRGSMLIWCATAAAPLYAQSHDCVLVGVEEGEEPVEEGEEGEEGKNKGKKGIGSLTAAAEVIAAAAHPSTCFRDRSVVEWVSWCLRFLLLPLGL